MAKTTKPAFDFSRYMKAEDVCKPRIVWAGYGASGSGKNHFAFTAPGPIVILSFDNNIKGVVEKFQDTKDIYVKKYKWLTSNKSDQSEAQDIRDAYEEDFLAAVALVKDKGTLVVDRESDTWELYRYAEFGAPNAGSINNYPALHAKIRKLLNVVKETDINCGFLQGLQNNWSSTGKVNQNTGKKAMERNGMKRWGWEELDSQVHVDMEHTFNEDAQTWDIYVRKARGIGSEFVQGQTFSNMDFPTMGQLLFPESEDRDWI